MRRLRIPSPGSCSFENCPNCTCNWTITREGSTIATGSGKTFSHKFIKGGSYTITLQACDEKGLCDSTSVMANIENAPPKACFEVTPEEGIIGITEFDFNAECSYDLDGYITKYEWNFGDEQTGTGEKTTHTYTHYLEKKEEIEITLTVTDNNDYQAIATETITLRNPAPKAKYTAVPLYGISPLTVVFSNNSTDPYQRKITKYSWDITGDGVEDYNEEHVIHTYNEPGTYTTSLTVWNEFGAKSEKVETTITVYELRAIKTLRAESIYQGQNLIIRAECAGRDPKINYTIKKGTETIGEEKDKDCGYIIHGPIEEPGLYEITATIPGCTTIECRKTTTFNVFEETPEETAVPETNALIAMLTAFAVLGIAGKKQAKRFKKQ